MAYDRRAQPFWKRVPWWQSLIVAAAAPVPVVPVLLLPSVLDPWLEAVLVGPSALMVVGGLAAAVVDVRRIRQRRAPQEA